uniref:Uncharacterized protein n=1 Tax=Arundo donax TaxID=35708 RepID=A0A0A9A4S8_ARUDO
MVKWTDTYCSYDSLHLATILNQSNQLPFKIKL